jgi:beta-glucosidase/6-phospho-beta-glucosidase/beta-galactosidase
MVWRLVGQWFEGYIARMGIIFVDFKTLKASIKASGYWLANYFGTA